MDRDVILGKRPVGHGRPALVIAEIGCNFQTAAEGIRLIEAAVECGADAVKIQTFEPETLTTPAAVFDMANTGVVAQREIFARYALDDEAHARLFEYAAENDVLFFSTPSSPRDLDRLETWGNPIYKLGSDDGANLPFIAETARRGLPLVLSTGMSTMEEVREAVDAVLATGNDRLVLLHCLSDYPAAATDVNLRVIPAFRAAFPGVPIGYSDHTLGPLAAWTAVALGACVIEKHFTLSQDAEGPDHALSADPDQLRRLVAGIRQVEASLGDGLKRPTPGEVRNRPNNRKSLVVTADLAAGAVLTADTLAIKRPGHGIAPKHLDQVRGRRLARPLAADTTLTWDMLEDA